MYDHKRDGLGDGVMVTGDVRYKPIVELHLQERGP